MNLLADESVDMPVVLALRDEGYDVISVLEEFPGIADVQVSKKAFQMKRFMITADKDFGELVVKSKVQHYGVLLYRLNGLTNKMKAEIIVQVLKDHESELKENFSVVNKNHLRIRKLN